MRKIYRLRPIFIIARIRKKAPIQGNIVEINALCKC